MQDIDIIFHDKTYTCKLFIYRYVSYMIFYHASYIDIMFHDISQTCKLCMHVSYIFYRVSYIDIMFHCKSNTCKLYIDCMFYNLQVI